MKNDEMEALETVYDDTISKRREWGSYGCGPLGARARELLAIDLIEVEHMSVDQSCVTTCDGGCIADGCMHTKRVADTPRCDTYRVKLTEKGVRLVDRRRRGVA